MKTYKEKEFFTEVNHWLYYSLAYAPLQIQQTCTVIHMKKITCFYFKSRIKEMIDI